MKSKLDRVISVLTLVASLVAIILVLKRPAPMVQSEPAARVASRPAESQPGGAEPGPGLRPGDGNGSPPVPEDRAPVAARANSLPAAAPEVPQNSGPSSGVNSRATPDADAVSAMLAKTLGGGPSGLGLDSNVGSGTPNIKDQQVTMEGDILHGKFLTEIAGKDVWVTISGHMGEKDGYATFDPTEIKVGDMDVPVSLVNPLLQKKMAEERDRFKIPGNSGQP
jgi:hypothetical protein